MRALLLALCAAFAAPVAPAAADRFALTYKGAALGVVDLGEATLDADVGEDDYQISGTLESRGLLSLFERTRIRVSASGAIVNGAVRWRQYDLDHHYSRKHRTIAMRAGEDGATVAEINPTYRIWGDPPATEQQQRISRDPLSTLMAMAIDIGQNKRCSGAYPTFDGRFHYLLELGGGGEMETYDGGGYEGPVMRCTLSYIAVSGFEQRDRGRRRVPHGQIWFALMEDSRFAPPVRIELPLAAGGTTIRLTQWRRPNITVAADNGAP